MAGFCGAGCGPLWEEHCQGTCPPEDVGVLVDDGSVQKSIWVDGSSYGFEADFFPFCVLTDSDGNATHVVVNGKHNSLVIEVHDAEPEKVHALSGNEIYVLDFESDGRYEYLTFEYGDLGLDSTARLFDEGGMLIWSDKVANHRWQSADLRGDAVRELLVYGSQGLIVVRIPDGSFHRIGNQKYYRADISEVGGDVAITAYASESYDDEFGVEFGSTVEVFAIDGTLMATNPEVENESLIQRSDGQRYCEQSPYVPVGYDGSLAVDVSYTTLTYSSAIGLFLGGSPRGTPENRTIRTGVTFSDVNGAIVYDEVFAGGSQDQFVLLCGSAGACAFLFTDGSRLIRYQVPDSL